MENINLISPNMSKVGSHKPARTSFVWDQFLGTGTVNEKKTKVSMR
jgi:hypothetical protein